MNPTIESEATDRAYAGIPSWPAGRADTVPGWFEDQVRRTPGAVALVQAGADSWTYAHLNARANRIAHRLLAHGVGPGSIVGLHLPRSADCVAAMLGVLKAGAAYLPLEPHVHRERLLHYVRDASPLLALSAEPAAAGQFGIPVLDLADEQADMYPDTDPQVALSPEDVVYVPYTSGSTGLPKGTLVPHRAVPGFFRGEDYAYWGPGAIAVMHCALSWDGHIFDVYPVLLSGGTLLIPDHGNTDPIATANTAADHGATVLFLTTAAFNLLAVTPGAPARAPRHVLFGGEAVSVEHARQVARRYPETDLVHCYGPSEATVFTTVHPGGGRRPGSAGASRSAGPWATGACTSWTAGCVRAARANRASCYISGACLGHGYLNRAGLTAQKFVPDPYGRPGARMYRTGEPGARAAGRLAGVRRPPRRPGQDPRAPDRARRDRERPGRAPGRGGLRRQRVRNPPPETGGWPGTSPPGTRPRRTRPRSGGTCRSVCPSTWSRQPSPCWTRFR